MLEVVAETIDSTTGSVDSVRVFLAAKVNCRIVDNAITHGTVSLYSANNFTMTLVVGPQAEDFQQISIFFEGLLVEWLFYKAFRLTHTKLDCIRRDMLSPIEDALPLSD